MKISPLNRLLITQFLSAMADNAILMATLHVIIQNQLGSVYLGIVQASFFFSYVLLAPYVSVLSERIPKAKLLWVGNLFKLLGAICLLIGVNPAVAYAIVGVGACIYSPGKYAILQEKAYTRTPQELYRANGLIEGSTIVAILIGTIIGGFLSTSSFLLAMVVILSCYMVSFMFAWILPNGEVSNVSFRHTWKHFGQDIVSLIHVQKSKSALLGTSSFWMTSSVLRLAMLSWIPLALHLSGEDKSSLFMGISAIGIMIGAVLSPRLIPLSTLKRLLLFGGGMGLTVAMVCLFPHMVLTVVILFFAGFFGGVYMIPLNTILQESGGVVGTGKTIAIQNFFENLMMFTGTLVFTGLMKVGISIPIIMVGFGITFFFIAFYVKHDYVSSKNSIKP
ncbi:lysophospholipid transporter LplT (plasmid) [Aneurinibacillus sp. Ricciae_BoGa-3]|uniref:lysophospholipid transporter LplT n=1 Tax=Aneurinibacillus sp. Ricciae_BoGa-3 TaxID=3022697 RepID=UPI0023426938|nr:lysophospholipid transporter LplT [Aneurinibacillus sp. Ricciae_BoGa-3]WCK57318.1 lysophospholipid transporter LplT [Aneurinibacillus sp. Ricciae_BoGa-3]